MRALLALALLLPIAAPSVAADDTCVVVGCVQESQYAGDGCGGSAAPPGETFAWAVGAVVWMGHVCGGTLAGEYNWIYVGAGPAVVFWAGQDGKEVGFRSGSLQAGASAPMDAGHAYVDWYGYSWYGTGDCRMTLLTSAGDHDLGCPLGIPPTARSLPAGSVLP